MLNNHIKLIDYTIKALKDDPTILDLQQYSFRLHKDLIVEYDHFFGEYGSLVFKFGSKESNYEYITIQTNVAHNNDYYHEKVRKLHDTVKQTIKFKENMLFEFEIKWESDTIEQFYKSLEK